MEKKRQGVWCDRGGGDAMLGEAQGQGCWAVHTAEAKAVLQLGSLCSEYVIWPLCSCR